MRLSVLAVAAAAFGAVQAATPTVVAPTAGQTIGTSVDLEYVNPDRTETNPRFASSLVVSLANSTINKAFSPGPKFPDDDPTASTATLIVDSTELVEGEYCAYRRPAIVLLADAISFALAFVVIENGPRGSIFEKDFIVTLSFVA